MLCQRWQSILFMPGCILASADCGSPQNCLAMENNLKAEQIAEDIMKVMGEIKVAGGSVMRIRRWLHGGTWP